MISDQNLLSIRQLSYWFGKRQAVREISLDIRRGEVLGLLGPNGAGKTTTISCIAGLLKDWTGQMQFNGRQFTPAVHVEDRLQLGFVPQELAIYPNLTADENLAFFAQLSGVPAAQRKQAVKKNLELAGLTDRRHDLVSTFSGGMQRRLNLAAGLVNSPALILLDEPTVGVDPQSRNHIFETLLRLRGEGHSLIYTTHYMEEAQRLCDRIAVMHDGVIAAVGTHAELAKGIGDEAADLEKIFLQLTGRSLRDE